MTRKVVVVGGGGHARVILDILKGDPSLEVAGFTDPELNEKITIMMGCPRLGTDEVLPELLRSGIDCAFIAIGNNRRRKQCAAQVEALGFSLINAVSQYSVISAYATNGKLVAVMPGAVVNAGSHINDGAIINTNATVDHDCVIGAFAHIGPGASLAGSVNIGDEVLIGVGARLIPGVKIGARTVVGAGAVVIDDLPADVIAVGVPAVVKKR